MWTWAKVHWRLTLVFLGIVILMGAVVFTVFGWSSFGGFGLVVAGLFAALRHGKNVSSAGDNAGKVETGLADARKQADTIAGGVAGSKDAVDAGAGAVGRASEAVGGAKSVADDIGGLLQGIQDANKP
jgi:hypothetical protein